MKTISVVAKCFTPIPSALCALLLAAVPESHAATIVWSGASGTDTNWSTVGNWAGGLPGAGDDVKFFNAGANATASNINNVVDGSSTIASLQFGNTNNFHTTLIAGGQTLNVSGAGGLLAGTGTDQTSSQSVFATVVGPGSLSVNNTAANILVGQGNTAGSSATLKATLDLRGLDNFSANVNRIGVGGRSTFSPLPPDRQAGALYLARTNVITTAFAPASYTTYPVSFPIILHDNEGNTAGTLCQLFLGQTNTIFTDGIAVGTAKCGGGSNPSAGAWLGFNPAVTNSNPVAYIRGTGGAASRVTRWTSGDGNASGNSSNGSTGTNDFSNGTLDALVGTLILGKDRGATTSKTFPFRGVFSFTAGTVDVNNLILGNQITAAAANPCLGIMNVRGTAALVVNNTLELGHTDGSSNATFGQNAPTNTTGQLVIVGGAVRASNIITGTLSATNLIAIDGGKLAVSNSISYPATANLTLTLTNATLEFSLAANRTNALVKDLITGAGANVINIAAAPTFASYPARVPLIKYIGSIGGAGYNFTLGSVPANVIGHLENNTLGASVDLVLDTPPFPVVTDDPDSVAIAPGQDAAFTVAASGVAPFTYQWRREGTNISDGGNVWGTSTATLSITNTIEADSGNYSVVIGNSYGSVTSAVAVLVVSSTPVAPTITGPANQTVIQGNNATFTASVAGLPIPTVQWQKNGVDISGATSSTLTITNAQYPADNATYSIIASNTAGAATNSATLSVFIPPAITTQPTNKVVLNGAAASFSVGTTGVPAPGYQWKKNGTDIVGENGATLSFASVVPADAATYSVLVTNAAGSVLSSNATLLVNSAMQVTNLFPANGATEVCVDSQLKLAFNQSIVLGNAGRIRIYNVTNATTPVDTIDVATAVQTKTIGGSGYNYRPVLIEGNTAYVLPHVQLQYGQTYYVTVESVVGGVFKDTLGLAFSGISATNAWQFSTKAAAPTTGTTNLIVAADNSGDFATVQGAAEFIPANNTIPTVVNIRNGTYREIVYVSAKNNLTFKGENRQKTIITYANNDALNAGTAGRCMFRCRGNDNAIVNLTLTNSTPQGGTQAEALRVDGLRFIAQNADFYSLQDTILVNNSGDQSYIADSLVAGNVDFIWGIGTMYFTNCEIRTIKRSGGNPNGYMCMPRTDQPHNGIAYVRCQLTANDTFPEPQYLARTGGDAFPYGSCAYISCSLGTHIPAVGWDSGGMTLFGNLRFWEYGSTALDGVTPIDTSSRASFSVQLNASQAAAVVDVTNWFGGWLPQLAPYLSSQPTNLTVALGQAAAFSAAGQGIPAPAYQWLKNGSPLANATNATLNLASAGAGDAANYSVIVSNSAGSVTSSIASLTVNVPPAPTISSPTLSGGQLSFVVSGSAGYLYGIQTSTNLVNWQTVFSTNATTMPFGWTDPSLVDPQRFYRAVINP